MGDMVSLCYNVHFDYGMCRVRFKKLDMYQSIMMDVRSLVVFNLWMDNDKAKRCKSISILTNSLSIFDAYRFNV